MSDQTGLRLVAIEADRPGTVELDGVPQPTITAALAAAAPGSVVTLGRGRFSGATEAFPLRIPAEVTLTGPEPRDIPDEAKKFLPVPPPAEIVAASGAITVDGDDVRLAHLSVRTLRSGSTAAVTVEGADRTAFDTVSISGGLRLRRTAGTRITWCDLDRGGVDAAHVEDLTITGGTFTGTGAAEPLVRVARGTEVRIEATAMPGAGAGIIAKRCVGILVAGCAVLAERDAVHVADSEGVRVNGNRLRGNRAVHLVRCHDGDVSANGVERAQTAFTLRDCDGVTIGFNHIAEADVDVAGTTG